jgi:hypothetical protein
MTGLVIGLAAQAAAASFNPNANLLFDRDSELRAWAVRLYDKNRDGWLTLYEAQPALRAFKEIADGDRDGRVTIHEYRRAKQFIAGRW